MLAASDRHQTLNTNTKYNQMEINILKKQQVSFEKFRRGNEHLKLVQVGTTPFSQKKINQWQNKIHRKENKIQNQLSFIYLKK